MARIWSPQELITWLSSLPTQNHCCLEAGAGHAEIAALLAPHFEQAYALDIVSRTMPVVPNLTFIQGDANDIPFENEYLDLIISVQSLHHFDAKRHLSSAHRTLSKGGILACLCWGDITLPDAISTAYKPVFDAINPYWEAERDWVLSGYHGLAFDGDRIALPQARISRTVDLYGFEDIIAGWSAFRKAAQANVDLPEPETEKVDLDDNVTFDVSWPLLGHVFRK